MSLWPWVSFLSDKEVREMQAEFLQFPHFWALGSAGAVACAPLDRCLGLSQLSQSCLLSPET